MRRDDLDRILADEEDVLPSSAFSDSVMDALRRQVSAPAPIPFPWRRACPGFGAAAVALAAAVVMLVRGGADGASRVPPSDSAVAIDSLLRAALGAGAHWVALAVLVTMASLALSARLANARS